jgi:hypothetical protein
LFQDQANEYRLIVDADGYAIKTIDLFPLNTEYTITLDKLQASAYSNVYQEIWYSLYPSTRQLNISAVARSISLNIYSSDSTLEYYGVYLTDHSYVCVPASCKTNISSSASGGTASVSILANSAGSFDVHYFFKKQGFDVQYIHGSIYWVLDLHGVISNNAHTILAGLRNQFKNAPIMMGVLAMGMTVGLVAIAAQVGIMGVPLLVVVLLAHAVFMFLGFIPWMISMVTIIIGLIILVATWGSKQ